MSFRVRQGLASLEYDAFGPDPALDAWVVGSAFAFERDGTSPESIVFFGDPEGRVLGPADKTVKVHPETLPLPELAAVFTDKELYREGRDVVRIGVFAPSRRGEQVEIGLTLNGAPLRSVHVAIGAAGLGLFEYPEPVAGEYLVMLRGASATKVNFTVAEYKLAPLTARFDGYSLASEKKSERLRFAAILETFGVPFSGDVTVQLVDQATSAGVVKEKVTLTADARGRIEGVVTLEGAGPFVLTLAAVADAQKTATLPVPGSRAEERSELVLSDWGKKRVARLLPFDGATEIRGLYVGVAEGKPSIAPLSIVTVERDRVVVKVDVRANAVRLAVLDPTTGRYVQIARGETSAGTELELPLFGAWSLVFAGVSFLGQCFEGRAAVPRPVAPPLDLANVEASEPSSIEVVPRAEPGERIRVKLRGPANATAFVVVKDERLQVVSTPVASTAASLRRQIERGFQFLADARVDRALSSVLAPPPAMLFAGGPPQAIPRAAGGRMGMAMPVPSAPPGVRTRAAAAVLEAVEASAAAETKTRTEFPEVVLAKLVDLDADGRAEVEVTLGHAMGSMKVEAFVASGFEWSWVERTFLVTRELFGELVLPRFVRAGDPAEGRLYVRVSEGIAKVGVTRDGRRVTLRGEAGDAEEVEVTAPGATVSFDAAPGKYSAEVRGPSGVDRSEGKVEEPGKLVWLQKAVRMLQPGERVSLHEPGALALELLPGLDAVFDGMVGGLRSYEHACCEQTSAVLLAAAAAYATAKDDDQKRAAATHIRGCIAREKRMYLKGRGFKGWPHYPDEVFMYSPGATLNLLQLDLLKSQVLDAELARSVDECLEMAVDAAKAHKIEVAPEKPKSAREAYGRFSRFVEDRQRMAAFIRERVEPWEKEMKAILKFELPGMKSETYHRTPAMIRAETAFGAAALIELGGDHRKDGLTLANTVLGAIREGGAMYSTLDSVAAITLLNALQRAKVVSSPSSKLLANGASTTLRDAFERKDLQSVEAVEGPLQVQLTRLVEEDYTAMDRGVTAKVALRRVGRVVNGPVRPGDALELRVELTSGYEAGDLLHVFLPDCLSWVKGGGQVKKFSLDFTGQKELVVPLAVTGATFDANGQPAPQHFAVAVRNMYDEERGKGFGDLAVTVDPGSIDPPGLADRVMRGLKALLG